MKKKIIGVILALAMLACMIPLGMVTVSAETEPTEVQLWEGGPMWSTSNLGQSEILDHPEYGALYNFETALTEVAKLGDGWRLPTKLELDALLNNCTWEWDNGWTVTGKGDYSSNSIFLPAAGTITKTSRMLTQTNGIYWSSDVSDQYDGCAFCLDFTSDFSEETSVHDSYEKTFCFSVRAVKDAPAAPAIPDNASVITAEITAADFGYTMVIPTSTTLTEAKHENVLLGTTAAADGDGIVSIKDIKHPTNKVNVYYTVDLTNGDLTDGTTTIEAAYKYKQGDDQFAAIDGETKVTVYENATVKNSLVNVTADDTQWKAAPVGTYNATVVFNFAEEDAVQMVTVNFTTRAGSVYQYSFKDSNEQMITSVQVPKGTTCSFSNIGVTFSTGLSVGSDPKYNTDIFVENVNKQGQNNVPIEADTTFEFYSNPAMG